MCNRKVSEAEKGRVIHLPLGFYEPVKEISWILSLPRLQSDPSYRQAWIHEVYSHPSLLGFNTLMRSEILNYFWAGGYSLSNMAVSNFSVLIEAVALSHVRHEVSSLHRETLEAATLRGYSAGEAIVCLSNTITRMYKEAQRVARLRCPPSALKQLVDYILIPNRSNPAFPIETCGELLYRMHCVSGASYEKIAEGIADTFASVAATGAPPTLAGTKIQSLYCTPMVHSILGKTFKYDSWIGAAQLIGASCDFDRGVEQHINLSHILSHLFTLYRLVLAVVIEEPDGKPLSVDHMWDMRSYLPLIDADTESPQLQVDHSSFEAEVAKGVRWNTFHQYVRTQCFREAWTCLRKAPSARNDNIEVIADIITRTLLWYKRCYQEFISGRISAAKGMGEWLSYMQRWREELRKEDDPFWAPTYAKLEQGFAWLRREFMPDKFRERVTTFLPTLIREDIEAQQWVGQCLEDFMRHLSTQMPGAHPSLAKLFWKREQFESINTGRISPLV
jgi:hypothetical protein